MSDAIAKKQPNDLKSLIHQMKSQFALALPKHITPDRFMRVALTAVNKNPKLLSCTKESVLACLMDCSQAGLEPDGRKSHLIPYGNQCQLIFDYKGLVELARRSGEIAYIHADVVCENDVFEYTYGSGAILKHSPALRNRGEVTQAYSFVKLKDGSEDFHVMNLDEVNAIKGRSKAHKSGPWVTDFAEMAKKTVFRRHSKWLPLSSEFQEAVDKDFDVPIDINKSVQEAPIEMPKRKQVEVPKAEEEEKPKHPSEQQIKALLDMSSKNGVSEDKLAHFAMDSFGAGSYAELSLSEYQKCMKFVLENASKDKAQEAPKRLGRPPKSQSVPTVEQDMYTPEELGEEVTHRDPA